MFSTTVWASLGLTHGCPATWLLHGSPSCFCFISGLALVALPADRSPSQCLCFHLISVESTFLIPLHSYHAPYSIQFFMLGNNLLISLLSLLPFFFCHFCPVVLSFITAGLSVNIDIWQICKTKQEKNKTSVSHTPVWYFQSKRGFSVILRALICFRSKWLFSYTPIVLLCPPEVV